MEIRDIPVIYQIIIRNFKEVMSKHHSPNILENFISHISIESLNAQMNWKEILVAEEDNEIIGTGALANFGSSSVPKYCISNLFIKPEFHHCGVGKLLFMNLFKLFNIKKAKNLHVPSSRNAIHFYEKMGFIQDKEQPDVDSEITWMTFISS